MTDTALHPEQIKLNLVAALGDKAADVSVALGEVTVTVLAANYVSVMQILRDAHDCKFEQLLDLCGMDYSAYREVGREGPRFKTKEKAST